MRDGCISLFFCIILLCIISCSNLNGCRVDDCVDGEDDQGGVIEAIPKNKAEDLLEIIRSGM
jgi:hypothetical protein